MITLVIDVGGSATRWWLEEGDGTPGIDGDANSSFPSPLVAEGGPSVAEGRVRGEHPSGGASPRTPGPSPTGGVGREVPAPLARGEAPGFSGHVFAPGGKEKVEMALAAIKAGLPDMPIDRIHAGVTGLTETAPAAAVIRAMLSEAIGVPPANIRVESDIALLARRTFKPGEGYLIYAGTGSVGAYLTPEGEVVTVGGKGILIDDAGGGAWIALAGLRAVLRREEEEPGAGFATILGRELTEEMGGSDWDTIRALVYGGDRGTVGLLALAVARAAKRGDAVAIDILREADRELMRLAEVLKKRFGDKRVVVRGRAAGMLES